MTQLLKSIALIGSVTQLTNSIQRWEKAYITVERMLPIETLDMTISERTPVLWQSLQRNE